MIPSVGKVPTVVSGAPTRTPEAPPASPTAADTIVTISPAARVTYLYAAGLSTAQIAARTGLPIDTIRRILGLAA
jgi:DNA-directed RNA polymerase specialized sigma24 family protein